MAKAPIVQWYVDSNTEDALVTGVVSYGTVTADTDSEIKEFYIWNNRGGVEECSKMEDVKFTTRDRLGGLGDTTGNIVEAVKDNWFKVRVDSLDETNFTRVGKGGVGSGNESGLKILGTNGKTRNLKADDAVDFTSDTSLSLGTIIRPSEDNGFIYEVVQAGVTGSAEPTWLETEGLLVESGSVHLKALEIEKKPAIGEILGMPNDTLADGSNADLAGGNFVKISAYAEVPITASSGANQLSYRVQYKHL